MKTLIWEIGISLGTHCYSDRTIFGLWNKYTCNQLFIFNHYVHISLFSRSDFSLQVWKMTPLMVSLYSMCHFMKLREVNIFIFPHIV